MLQYPETVANRPLLRFALENMADGSPLSLACYEAVLPLGIVHNAILRNADHWNVVYYLWKHPLSTPSPDLPLVAGRSIGRHCTNRRSHYTVLIPTTTSSGWITNSGTASFASFWYGEEIPGRTRFFFAHSHGNKEWIDLEFCLCELTELGAQPLLLSTPIHGGWYDQVGITHTARRANYQDYGRPAPAITLRSSISLITRPISPSATTTWGTWLPVDWCITAKSSRFLPRRDPTPARTPLPCPRVEHRDRSWSPVPAGSPFPNRPRSVSTTRPPRRR